MATSTTSTHASASTPAAVAADVLWKYQLRREHKALLDITESDRKQAISQAAEFETLVNGLAVRCTELENAILQRERTEDLRRIEHKALLDRVQADMKQAALKEADNKKVLITAQNEAAALAARVSKLEGEFLDLYQDNNPKVNVEQRSSTQQHPDLAPFLHQLPVPVDANALQPPRSNVAAADVDTLTHVNPADITTFEKNRTTGTPSMPPVTSNQIGVDYDRISEDHVDSAGTSSQRKRRAELLLESQNLYTKRRQNSKADFSRGTQKTEKPAKLSQRRLPIETYYNNTNQFFSTLPDTGREAELEFVNSFLGGIQGAKDRDKVIRIMQQLYDSRIFNKQVRIECRWDQVLEGLVTAGMLKRQS